MEIVDNDERSRKKIKLTEYDSNADFVLNKLFSDKVLIDDFRKQWQHNLKYNENDVHLRSDPFKIGVISNVLHDENNVRQIYNEMLDLYWYRKQMDLYEFYQSDALDDIQTNFLQKFNDVLKTKIKPWIESACQLKIDYISSSCSMYNAGDYLLVHDDLLTDRQIAFVFYISPWRELTSWSSKTGGALELFDVNENNFPKFPIKDEIYPVNNQFVFFKVDKKSFHQVSEILTHDYPRLTINGWFHGEPNESAAVKHNVHINIYKTPSCVSEISLRDWINCDYLKKNYIERIQEHFEQNSEISLENFFHDSTYTRLQNALAENENLKWFCKEPANNFHYEILDFESANVVLKDFRNLMNSQHMLKLLYKLTCLDLYGKNCQQPQVFVEVQKWNCGSYTVLAENQTSQDSSLDLIFFINANESVGITSYISKDDDDDAVANDEMVNSDRTLLTIYPKNNVLSLVYVSANNLRFTKYVSKINQRLNGPTYILYCSYKE